MSDTFEQARIDILEDEKEQLQTRIEELEEENKIHNIWYDSKFNYVDRFRKDQNKIYDLELSLDYQEKETEKYKQQSQLQQAKEALEFYAQCKHINLDLVSLRDGCEEFEAFENGEKARQALQSVTLQNSANSAQNIANPNSQSSKEITPLTWEELVEIATKEYGAKLHKYKESFSALRMKDFEFFPDGEVDFNHSEIRIFGDLTPSQMLQLIQILAEEK